MEKIDYNAIDHESKIVYFGKTNFRDQHIKFGIKTDDRRRHMYVIGKTGMGKSTLLENMIIQDIRMGHGVAYVDPHGDTVEKLLNYIPAHRINDVVYFNPADIDYPIAFNILESVDDPMKKNLVSSGLIAVFKKLWSDSWGPRLEYLLRNSILALLDYPGATLLGVTRMMTDKEFRKKVTDKIKDPVVKSFWLDEYTKYSSSFQVEAISPIQNKVGQFLSMSLIRNILGQIKSSIDMRDIMDKNKILLLNLSKGRIGEDASALLGAMMITRIQLAAMSRVDMPEKERQDFYLYVDEFQNFSTDSFANILSEARKYRLNLIMAHQYIEQIGEVVRAAVFGNIGTIVAFRVGAEDAEFLGKEFAPTFTETDLVNLTKYDMYLKLMIDGVTSNPFSATGLMPELGSHKEGNSEKIINVSRERYASRREVIEDKIARWTGADMETEEEKEKKKQEELKKTGFKANCSVCNKEIYTKFEPDGVRPVFCADHLKDFKEGKLDREKFVKEPSPDEKISSNTDNPQSKSKQKSSSKDNSKPKNKPKLSPAELTLAEAFEKGSISFNTASKKKSTEAILDTSNKTKSNTIDNKKIKSNKNLNTKSPQSKLDKTNPSIAKINKLESNPKSANIESNDNGISLDVLKKQDNVGTSHTEKGDIFPGNVVKF